MVTLNFETFPKMIIQDGLAHIPKASLEVVNPMAKEQEAKCLVPMMIRSGEIMWVHSDIVKGEQRESSKLNLKGKSYNFIFIAMDDDIVTVASSSDSK